MSHQVDYLNNDGSIMHSFLVRFEAASGNKRKEYFTAPMSFLTTRDAGSYGDSRYLY